MVAVVVALVFQILWTLARAILEYEGVTPTNTQVVGLSVACLAASYLTIAAATGGLARRLQGTRAVGAWIATIGFLAVVAGVAVYEGLIHASAEHPDAMSWAIALRVRGWSIAEAVAILGLALAAGQRGFWLAPPTIGLAVLNAQPGLTRASWSPSVLVGLLVVKTVLLAFIVAAAERPAASREPEPERAMAGLRRAELTGWLFAAISPLWTIAWAMWPTMNVALGSAFTTIAIEALFATAAWSVARAAIPGAPRWGWYASAMFSMWGLARLLRTWSLTLTRHWGDLDATPLKTTHWSAALPGLLSALCAMSALAVFAHRCRSRELMRTAITAAAFSSLAFGVHCALREQTAARVICYLVANLAAVRAYRVARTAIHGHVPRARVV